MKIVGLEEHYVTPEVVTRVAGARPAVAGPATRFSVDAEFERGLQSLGSERLAVMDDAGVDTQVLSLTSPGLLNLNTADAVALQTVCNAPLPRGGRNPGSATRFRDTGRQDPEAAAAELGRAVSSLGFHGSLIFSRTRDRSIDHGDFWPVFEAAEALGAPLYLHPQPPPHRCAPPTTRASTTSSTRPSPPTAVGWHYDAGVQLLRLILAGVFDRFPDLQVILGHWGEMVPFYLDRIDRLAPIAGLAAHGLRVRPEQRVPHAGRRFQPAVPVVGSRGRRHRPDHVRGRLPVRPDRRRAARKFLEDAALSDDDREKIASGNWARLCAGIRR